MEDTLSILHSFIAWKEVQSKIVRGEKTMYDIGGYYKFLDENKLFDYWYNENFKKECVTS
jgi:hypothetical protein